MKETNYMTDSRMSSLAGEPIPVQEVHAWRLAEQDEKQSLTPEQREAYYKTIRERTDTFCADHGIHLKYAAPVVMA
jgi:hypothetical protein